MITELLPVCTNCGKVSQNRALVCEKCGRIISYLPIKGPNKHEIKPKDLWSFASFLPKVKKIVSLNEGCTPTIAIKNDETLKGLVAKCEFRNPTGNFRDRASTLLVSDCLNRGVSRIVSASTGSFSISLSAYAARAQIKCTTVVPKHLELSKIEQIRLLGSEVTEHGENLADAVNYAEKISEKKNAFFITAENNILTIEGQKTLALELLLQIADLETIIVPRGTGSLAYSIFRGLEDAITSKWIDEYPTIITVALKKSYSSKFAESLEMKEKSLFDAQIKKIHEITHGQEINISADKMIHESMELAKKEGIFIEPASGSVLAAARQLAEDGQINNNKTAVILTSSGINALNVFAYQLRGKKKVVWGLTTSSTTKFEILNLIAEAKANHGYAIWKLLGENQTLQSIYQHLSELEKMGLIVAIPSKKRKEYRVTNDGYETLEKMRELIDLL